MRNPTDDARSPLNRLPAAPGRFLMLKAAAVVAPVALGLVGCASFRGPVTRGTKRGTTTTVAVAVALLPFAGAACAPDPTDPKTVERIAAEAIARDNLQERGDLVYAPNRQEPYSGWSVEYHDPQNMAQREGNESLPIESLREWQNGVFHGQRMDWYENGQMEIQGDYRDGEPHGQWTSWYENGQMESQREYRDGEEEGEQTYWHENGQMSIHRPRDGQYTSWRENGEVHGQGTMVNGRRHGEFTYWHENGQMSRHTGWADGAMHGDMTEWYENGQMSREESWVDGMAQGVRLWWHENGRLSRWEHWEDSRRDGWVLSWYENGRERSRHCYVRGEEAEDEECYPKHGPPFSPPR